MTPARLGNATLLLTLASCGACGAAATVERPADTVAVTRTSSHEMAAPATAAPRPHVVAERRTVRLDGCTVEATLPQVDAGDPESTSRITAVLETSLAGWAGLVTLQGCPTDDELARGISYTVGLDARGILALAIAHPMLPLDTFDAPETHAFVLATGEELTSDTLFPADRRHALEAHLAKEYDSAYHHRDDCPAGGYGADRGSFVFTRAGLAFDDWPNIPMAERNCALTVVTVPYAEIARYLRPDVAALVASR